MKRRKMMVVAIILGLVFIAIPYTLIFLYFPQWLDYPLLVPCNGGFSGPFERYKVDEITNIDEALSRFKYLKENFQGEFSDIPSDFYSKPIEKSDVAYMEVYRISGGTYTPINAWVLYCKIAIDKDGNTHLMLPRG